ncbi:hypothetical protein GGI11_002238 [Coemansia sp. RSA 2049]|nr:hypothetical protein GGI11_002238 [Coemansia sp. RSA 2049]
MTQQTFTFINHSGKLFDETLVYAGAVYGFDMATDFKHAFSLTTDSSGVVAKEVYYTGISMTGKLRGTDRSWIDFEGAGIKTKGERLSFGYTWCFKYPASGGSKRYIWRMERSKTRSNNIMYLENSGTSEIVATFRRCVDDEQVEGRLVLRVCPDLPLFMLILATCKLGLVRIQASDAGVPFAAAAQQQQQQQQQLSSSTISPADEREETVSSVSGSSGQNTGTSWFRRLMDGSKTK